MNTRSSIKIGPGTKFHSVIADSNPEWEVTGKRGRGVWEAKCLGEDYSGEIRVFTDAQIKQSVGMSQFFAKNSTDQDKFYASLRLGQVVHYDNSFEQWVRCEVVMASTVHDKTPHKCLKPIALLGKWASHDLPRRRSDGTVTMGYHAEKIAKGECMEPNFGSIYESGRSAASQASVNPATLAPLDLSVPEMTPNEAATAKLWQAVQVARGALDWGPNGEYRDPMSRLTLALKAIKEVMY